MTILQSRVCLVISTFAIWPIWTYYFKFGLQSASGGLLLLLLCVTGFFVYEQFSFSKSLGASKKPLFISQLFLIIYIFAYSYLPFLGRAILGMEVLAFGMLACYPAAIVSKRSAFIYLLPLALPLETALQYVLGYPFRRVTALTTSFILSSYGVTVEGTTLHYSNQALEVDAACSGALGFWAFLIIGGLIALLNRYSMFKTILSLVLAVISCMIYNVSRSSLLFMNKYHFGRESSEIHLIIGIITFVLSLVLFLFMITKLFPKRLAFNHSGNLA